MSGCQRCLECGCLAVSDVLCADVWLSAMSCVRMSGGCSTTGDKNMEFKLCSPI